MLFFIFELISRMTERAEGVMDETMPEAVITMSETLALRSD
jgi:hypothetical protein